MKNLNDQQKGSLMAFVAVMFITPDPYLSDCQMLKLELSILPWNYTSCYCAFGNVNYL